MRSMQLEKEQAALGQTAGTPYDEFGAVGTPFTAQRSYSGSVATFANTQQYSPPQPPPMPTPQLYNVSTPNLPTMTSGSGPKTPSNELDLNDPSTLDIYSRILLFKDDRMRDELAFSRTLTAKQRRVVHLVAQKLGVYHYSVGEGDERYAVVTRIDPALVGLGVSFCTFVISEPFYSSSPHNLLVRARHSRVHLRPTLHRLQTSSLALCA